MTTSDTQQLGEYGNLSGQRAVVTGASRGIGKAIAVELARCGADVLVHAGTDRARAAQTADQIRQLGRQAEVLLCDFASATRYDAFVDEAWRWAGNDLHIWINNAGADVLTGDRAAWPFERKLEYLWRVDVLATVALGRRIGRRMQQAPQPANRVILNLGWDRAEVGLGGDSGELFATVKAAVAAFSRSLAKTLAPTVRVNCLAPGWIRTAWGEQAAEYWQQRARREALRGRWGMPADVAQAARFLVSPQADFITGQVLTVNGGFRDADPTDSDPGPR